MQYKNKTNTNKLKQQTTMTIINIIFAVLSSLCALTFLVSSLISMISKNEKYETIANNSAINMCIYMFLWIAIISIF